MQKFKKVLVRLPLEDIEYMKEIAAQSLDLSVSSLIRKSVQNFLYNPMFNRIEFPKNTRSSPKADSPPSDSESQ